MRRKFIRQGISKKKLEQKWRRPRGIHSKLRLNKAGKRKKPSQGFRSSRKNRKPNVIVVTNAKDLANAKQSIILSSKLGLKKKLELLKLAGESKLKVLNVNNIEEFVKKSKEVLEKRKSEKKKKETDKKKSKEKAVKDAEKGRQKKEEEKSKIETASAKETANDVQQKQDKQIPGYTTPKQK